MPATDEKLNAHRRKIIWRAEHRGMKEMDIILGQYAREHVAAMDEVTLLEFERLIGQTDGDLYNWFVNGAPVPEALAGPLIDEIRSLSFTADKLAKLQ